MKDGPEDKKYLCKYQVKSMIVMKGEEKIEMDPSNILTIEYINDYEQNVMALVKVVLRIDIRKKLWILKNKREILVKFELNKIGMDMDVDEFITSPEEAWNTEFGCYFNDDDESSDPEVTDERIEMNEGENFQPEDIETENYYETQNMLDIFLIHPKLLKGSRTQTNRVFTESTLQNIIGELLTESQHKGVLMSKLENDEVYKELLLPVNPVYKNLIYMDQYYGFYKTGGIIYYDVDTLYILNSNGKLTAKREDEWTETTFLIPYLDDSTPGNGMVRTEGEDIYYPMVSEMDVNPQKYSIGKNAEIGSISKMVTTDGTEIDTREADQSYTGDRNESVTFIKKENKYANDIMQARMEENECILYITGENLDIDAFRPNKTYKVVFEEPSKQEKYGSLEYRITYAYHILKAVSEHYMDSSHRIIIKKVPGSSEVNGDGGDGMEEGSPGSMASPDGGGDGAVG